MNIINNPDFITQSTITDIQKKSIEQQSDLQS
jgi:hypothetical protein